jgi:hypothetical protein
VVIRRYSDVCDAPLVQIVRIRCLRQHSVRGCPGSISKWLSRDLQHQCASRPDIVTLVKLLDLFSASTVVAADFVTAADGLFHGALHLHLLHASLAEEVLCLQTPDSL